MAFTVQSQRPKLLWCWAAVASSVDQYFDPTGFSRQCEIANMVLQNVLPGVDCCRTPFRPECDRAASLEVALTKIGHLRNVIRGAMDFSDIRQERAMNLVICARVEWLNNFGHFVVISGIAVSASGVPWVIVNDPLYENSFVPYDKFRLEYRDEGRWTHTYRLQP